MSREKYNILIAAGKATMDHDPRVNEWLRTLLESCGRFDVTINEDFRGATPELLENYDAVLVNYFAMSEQHVFTRWGDSAEKALTDFVRSGKGVIFYHASAIYDQDNPDAAFKDMTGMDFTWERGFRKSPKLDMVIDFTDDPDGITKGIAPRSWGTPCEDLFVPAGIIPGSDIRIVATVFDALEDYVPDKMQKHILDNYDSREFEKLPNINQACPVVWTKDFGKGRVFCVTIGHGPDTIRRPPFVAMMCRGEEWACSGEATIAPPDLQYENRFRTWPYYLPVTYHDHARLMEF